MPKLASHNERERWPQTIRRTITQFCGRCRLNTEPLIPAVAKSAKRLRVVAILEDARWGGPQKRSADVAQALADAVDTLVVLPTSESERFSRELAERKVVSRTVALAPRQRGLTPMLRFLLLLPRDIFRLRNCIVQHKADVVHVNGGANWRGQFAARLAGVPVLWHLTETHLDRISLRGFKLFWRLAHGFISASHRSEYYYLAGCDVGQRWKFCFSEPVNCEAFKPQAANGRVNITVGLVGNVNPDKDILNFVRAAKILLTAVPGCAQFKIAGGRYDSQRDYIEKVDSENQLPPYGEQAVSLLGASDQIADFLNGLDIYVCSSANESSPISIWEALACGLPVVSTDVGDVKQLNESGGFAIVVPTADPEALAAAINQLMHSPELRTRLSQNARKFALDQLELSICARHHLEAYCKVAGIEPISAP